MGLGERQRDGAAVTDLAGRSLAMRANHHECAHREPLLDESLVKGKLNEARCVATGPPRYTPALE